MSTILYTKCNAEANFGFRDLIYSVLSQAGRPMTSPAILAASKASGDFAKLYANRPVPKTPHATLYARLSDEAKKPNGFVTRRLCSRTGENLYELVPGRTPSGRGRKLDYVSKNVYVYALKNETTGSYFYVGMGVGDRKNRHLIGKSHSRHVTNAVQEIRMKGHRPVTEVLKDNLSRVEARMYEMAFIKEHGRRDTTYSGTLVNQKG